MLVLRPVPQQMLLHYLSIFQDRDGGAKIEPGGSDADTSGPILLVGQLPALIGEIDSAVTPLSSTFHLLRVGLDLRLWTLDSK